jgi:hypothetical protein
MVPDVIDGAPHPAPSKAANGEAPAEEAALKGEASSAAPSGELSPDVSAFSDAIMSRALLPPAPPT